jgi:hypothetical protein
MIEVTSLFHLNVPRNTPPADLVGLSNFASRYSIPAIVVEPSYIEHFLIERMAIAGKYKIIAAIDFDTGGKKFAMEKFRALPRTSLEVDGFEILLSPGKNEADARNELRAIHSFVRDQISVLKTINYSLAMNVKPDTDFSPHLKALKDYKPALLRTDYNLELPDFDEFRHQQNIETIRAHSGSPIKLSTNITLSTIDSYIGKAVYFDVTSKQARRIIRQVTEREQQQNEAIK